MDFYEDNYDSFAHGLIDQHSHYTEHTINSILFIKNIIIHTIINYIKKTDNLLYAYTIDIIYKYQIENLILIPKGSNDLSPDKKKLFFLQIQILIRNIRINITRFLTLWSLSVLSPIIGIAIDAYYVFFDNKFHMTHHIISYTIGAIVLCIYNPIIGSLLIVLSDYIIKPIIDYINEHKIVSKYIFKTHMFTTIHCCRNCCRTCAISY